ncbi:MAG: peroxiredoxin [Cyanobacteria bacterium SIG28]|nr:peroxiredoxin [Cyanobacteria bacterium SIG28]
MYIMNNIKLQGIDVDGIEKEYSLNNFIGQKVILYFYPKDNTSGCTQEACDFRDNINRLTSFATVIGVSPDSIKSHLKFKEKQSLNFILLSDPEHKLAEAFNVWVEKSMYGRKYMGIERSTFVLDENLNIIKEWRKVKVKGHVDEVLEYLNA